MAKRKQYDLNEKLVAADAYCPKCKVICFYKIGDPHNWHCHEILIPIPDNIKNKK